jgi:hypothetical protein
MNWRRTALVFVTVGAIASAVGFAWRSQLEGDAIACEQNNLWLSRVGECPTTGPAVVLAVIGAVFAVIGVALLAGASRQGASS